MSKVNRTEVRMARALARAVRAAKSARKGEGKPSLFRVLKGEAVATATADPNPNDTPDAAEDPRQRKVEGRRLRRLANLAAEGANHPLAATAARWAEGLDEALRLAGHCKVLAGGARQDLSSFIRAAHAAQSVRAKEFARADLIAARRAADSAIAELRRRASAAGVPTHRIGDAIAAKAAEVRKRLAAKEAEVLSAAAAKAVAEADTLIAAEALRLRGAINEAREAASAAFQAIDNIRAEARVLAAREGGWARATAKVRATQVDRSFIRRFRAACAALDAKVEAAGSPRRYLVTKEPLQRLPGDPKAARRKAAAARKLNALRAASRRLAALERAETTADKAVAAAQASIASISVEELLRF